MKVNKELIEEVAKNARLELTEEEKELFVKDFQEILEAFKKLDECNTENTEPAFHPIELKDHLREDKVEESLSQKEALQNTKHKSAGFFLGPKTL